MNVEIGQADQIKNELDGIYDKLKKIDPEYVSIRRPKSLSKCDAVDRKIQQTLATTKKDNGKDAVIVEHFVSTDKIYIFVDLEIVSK